jgi:protein-S-isoprenylcysteine O-methyltransferase Ste14
MRGGCPRSNNAGATIPWRSNEAFTMKRIFAVAYGGACYAIFLGCFLYLVGFLAGFGVPKTIDTGGHGFHPAIAALIDLALIAVFGVQHSVMARPAFKRVWVQIVPRVVERSTYVLVSSITLAIMYAGWQPLPAIVWQAESTAAVALGWAVFAGGFGLVLLATFLIDHFDLFGLRQVVAYLLRRIPAPPAFQIRSLYRIVRHPLYVGWILAFWGTPLMTVGHALFAAGMTVYMLIAIRYEERDLVAIHGHDYTRYQAQVPMLIAGSRGVHPSVCPVNAAARKARTA